MPAGYGKYIGAGAGAAAGTMIMPGVGTVAGGALGYGLGGMLDGGGQTNREDPIQYNWEDANQMRTGALGVREKQGELASQLEAQANGTAPSVAQAQLAQARDANIRGYTSQAASARGGAAAHMLAQRQAADNSAQAQQQTAAQAATLRLQEQQGARQQLAQQQSEMRGADMRGQQMDQQRQIDVGSQSAQMAQTNAQIGMANSKSESGFLGGLMSLGGGLLSDRRAKQDIAPADREIRGFMDALDPERFRYRADPETQHYGVMAQDMERSPVGRAAVKEINGYRHIDQGEAQGITLAALANLNDRLSRMEKR